MPPKTKSNASAGGGGLDLSIGSSPKAKASMSSPLGRAGASMLGPAPKAVGASPRSGGKGQLSMPREPSPSSPASPKADSSSSSLGKSVSKSGTTVVSGRSNASRGDPGPRMADVGSARGERSMENGSASSRKASEGAEAAAAEGSGAPSDPAVILRFHSAVRWCKPWPEIEASLGDEKMAAAVRWQDPKNGNTALHIASQNGHLDIVNRLIAAGAPASAQNGKGQTALHMSVEYDFYFVSKALVDAGADKDKCNEDGQPAILGIEGSKTGSNAWNNQVTILKCANTREELDFAFTELEKGLATPELINKAELIQAGMAKKKSPVCKDIWDHKRFMQLAAQF